MLVAKILLCFTAKDQCHDNNPEIIQTHNIQRDNRKIESSIYENLLMTGRLLSNDSHAYLLIAKQTLGKVKWDGNDYFKGSPPNMTICNLA